MRMLRIPVVRVALVAFAFLLGKCVVTAVGGMWSAQPLVVHEWGVHQFDWSKGVAVEEPLPEFIYTDRKPGKPVVPPAPRAKDMPPDSGVRDKPILYFHTEGYMNKDVPVGVEVRFAYGHASAWWPQASVYRTPEQTAEAKPVDWKAWRKERQKKRWQRPLPPVPDDERFELVWHKLTLTKEQPARLALAGADLPDDHWVKLARQVDSYYVSNGQQAEKFLFYEGATKETPAIAILPPQMRDANHYVVNVGEFPVYDVFAIYRDKARGVVWSSYLAELPPVPKRAGKVGAWGHHVPQIVCIELPDFDAMAADAPIGDEEFRRRTSKRLIEALTAGRHYTRGWYQGMRDPADPQPAARMHQLRNDEAVALEAIWRSEFFQAEGLTVVYRESPASLDQAMPLHIYTDMFHYVMLSRCGLVLNQNVPYKEARAVAEAVRAYDREKDANSRAAMLALCRKHRFLALGLARFYERSGLMRYWGGKSTLIGKLAKE